MTTMTYTSARQKLAKTMEKVCEDHEPVVITRQAAKPVVLISLDDYEALNETNYLLRSPKNAARLAKAIKEIESGKAREKSISEKP